MVFALRLIQEKCREQNKGVFITFVVVTKAFDTVSRKGLKIILGDLGYQAMFLGPSKSQMA